MYLYTLKYLDKVGGEDAPLPPQLPLQPALLTGLGYILDYVSGSDRYLIRHGAFKVHQCQDLCSRTIEQAENYDCVFKITKCWLNSLTPGVSSDYNQAKQSGKDELQCFSYSVCYSVCYSVSVTVFHLVFQLQCFTDSISVTVFQ